VTAAEHFFIVSDNADDRALISLVLRQEFGDAVFEEAGDAISFAERFAEGEFTVAIMARILSWGDGLQVLEALRNRYPACLLYLLSDSASRTAPRAYSDLGLAGHFVNDSSGLMALPKAIRQRMERPARTHLGDEARCQELLEELSRQSEALERAKEEMEQLTYAVSHDLQEPLHLVTSHARLLTERYSERLDGEARRSLGHLAENSERMQAMINGALDYFRAGNSASATEPVNFGNVVDNAVANLGTTVTETGARIQHNRLPTLTADRRQMVQLFQNLIGNAIKFRGDAVTRIVITARERDADWEFAVQDNGIGIDPRYHDRIFGMFQRLHTSEEYPGTGIGLPMCKRVVERHGGKIWVTSAPGKGSTFFITLPKSTGSEAHPGWPAPDEKTGRRPDSNPPD